MVVRELHDWPATAAEAEAIQDRLRPLLELDVPGPAAPRTVAGLDVSYAGDGGGTGVAQGTPEDLAKTPASWTGRFLAKSLGLDKPARRRSAA